MKITIDLKTLAIGILLGVVIAMVSGAGSASSDDNGFAVQNGGYAIVRTLDGGFYVVNPQTAMATRVMAFSSMTTKPDSGRTSKGYLLSTDTISKPRR